MTPQACIALGVLLIELRDWLEDTEPGSLDAHTADHLVEVVARVRRTLVEAGAR